MPHRFSTLFSLVAFLAMPGLARSAELEAIIPPKAQVAGKSQADWSMAWWQWAASFDSAESPVADRTGENCHLKQDGPVWFLAGTYGTKRTVRTCTIPRGKYLFFPLINYVYFLADPASPPTCASVTLSAQRATDNPSLLVLNLDGADGTELSQYRQATSPCFNLAALADPPAPLFPSAANGYYVMLRPLPPGKHELNFGGILPNMSQAVTYRLVVK
jgi:hypothetical protein